MSEDVKCPSCGASVPDTSDVPGEQTSSTPATGRCPNCGTALGPDPQPAALEDGGWHKDGEPQA